MSSEIISGWEGSIKVANVEIGYISSFNLQINCGTDDISRLGHRADEYRDTNTNWTVSFEGTFDNGDAKQKAIMDSLISDASAQTPLALAMKAASGTTYYGNALVTSAGVSVSRGSKVSVSFSAQGTGALATTAPTI